MQRLDIRSLLQTTLALSCLAGASCDRPGDSADCDLPPDEHTRIDVAQWHLGPTDLAEAAETYDAYYDDYYEYGEEPDPLEAWATLDEEAQCELACEFVVARAMGLNWGDFFYGYDYVAIDRCELAIPESGATVTCSGTLVEDSGFCIGRPALHRSMSTPHRPVSVLDAMAQMEHDSVAAFEELAAQLRRLGAPVELVARALESANDERHHVELLVGLGARRPRDRVAPSPEASLEALARHNAVAGCVTETWAALLAMHQAAHADDPRARRAHARIADDETRHAQLAWDLHRWCASQLDPDGVAEIEHARLEALVALPDQAEALAAELPARTRHALGLPDPARARGLAASFAERLAG